MEFSTAHRGLWIKGYRRYKLFLGELCKKTFIRRKLGVIAILLKNNGCTRLFSERIHFRPPFSNVFLVASIEGDLNVERLEAALRKTAIRHPLLTASIQTDEEGYAWFKLSEGNAKPDLTVIPKKGDGHWQEVFLEEEKRPFSLTRGPLARFVLLQDRGAAPN